MADMLLGLMAAASAAAPAGVPEGRPPGRRVPHLGRRETEVLQTLLGCDSNREVAADLGITEATVKTHTNRINKALGTRSRHRALVEALRHGLIQLPRIGGGMVGEGSP